MTGSTKDPENGPAVAGSVFAAVVVYAVSLPCLSYKDSPSPALCPSAAFDPTATTPMPHNQDVSLQNEVHANNHFHSASWSSAVSKPTCMFDRVKGGRYH